MLHTDSPKLNSFSSLQGSVRLRIRISDLLAYITYFIVTVIIGLVERAANMVAAGMLVVGIECRLPARYARRYAFPYDRDTHATFVSQHLLHIKAGFH